MSRFSGLFGRGKNDDSSSKSSSSKLDPERFGVSLKFLASLPIETDDPYETDPPFNAACEYVKKKTKKTIGYRSFAQFLFNNRKTRHLVKEQADVFISYAWSGGFEKTMSALLEHFGDKEDVFVWMDFAVVDQHAAAETNIQFDQWAETFRENLKRIGKAVLVLTPGEKPIAITRAWCCFEWASIVQSEIPFEYCVTKEDVEAMISQMKNGMGTVAFDTLFAGINVEKAEAFKPSDQESILALMKEIGVVKVNDIVMKSLKGWLLEVNKEGLQRIGEQQTKETAALFNARGALHLVLVRVPYMLF